MQWGAANVVWDGREFVLSVPAYVEALPAGWLRLELGSRLSAALGSPVSAEITPARREGGGYSDVGEIRVGPIRTPLPNPGVLHKTVGDAVSEAYAQARAAEAEMNPWLEQLRGLPNTTAD